MGGLLPKAPDDSQAMAQEQQQLAQEKADELKQKQLLATQQLDALRAGGAGGGFAGQSNAIQAQPNPTGITKTLG